MGQQPSLNLSTPQNTDRSISFLAEPSDRDTIQSKLRATKTITVTSVDELNLLKEMFNFRLINKNYLTYCYGFEVIDANSASPISKISCLAPFSSIKVNFHYQKITAKFSDLYQIPIQHGFQLLAHCLNAFSILYDQFGYFTPESRQINRQADEWKVWISDNIFALKSKSKKISIINQVSKEKFFQQVVHLFDALRDDEQPEFSYSIFIYGKTKHAKFLPLLSLNQILETFNHKSYHSNSVKTHHQRASLRRLTFTSNSTARRLQCNNLISFDQKANDMTLPKFNNRKDTHFNKSLHESKSIKDSQNQNLKTGKTKCYTKHESFHHENVNSSLGYNSGERSLEEQNHELSKFRRLSSKIIHGTTNNDLIQQEFKLRHQKNKSTASTPSNCTGLNQNIKPLQYLTNKINMEMAMHNGSFAKKQRSFTMDFTSNGSSHYQQEIDQVPIKITQNSQVNSDSAEINSRNNQFDKAFFSSERQDQKNESEQVAPVQIISKHPTSHNSPSIARKTRKCGKETMKLLKEYLMVNSKGEHKRSMTDHACLETENKIKYCWSQEFDSEFFSVQSKTPSKPEVNSENIKSVEKQAVKERGQQDGTIHRELNNKKPKITFNEGTSVFSYNRKDSDGICENSNGEKQSEYNGASMEKLAGFKSEGFKSLLRNSRLNTLQSIRQIDVDYPMDEEILNDMNKLFPKRRFAKSSKLTKIEGQQ